MAPPLQNQQLQPQFMLQCHLLCQPHRRLWIQQDSSFRHLARPTDSTSLVFPIYLPPASLRRRAQIKEFCHQLYNTQIHGKLWLKNKPEADCQCQPFVLNAVQLHRLNSIFSWANFKTEVKFLKAGENWWHHSHHWAIQRARFSRLSVIITDLRHLKV